MANISGKVTVPGSNINITTQDEQVKVTTDDTTAGFLFDKVTSGDGSVTFSVDNPGGIERLDIRASGSGSALEVPALVGAILDIDGGESLSAIWGDKAPSGVTFFKAGELLGMSVALDKPLAGSGSINFRTTIDGIAQNGAGQTMNVIFTGPTQTTLLEYPAAISVSAGQSWI